MVHLRFSGGHQGRSPAVRTVRATWTIPATTLAVGFTDELDQLRGPEAVACALPTLVAGNALDRIADHASVIGARLRYLSTGDPDHLASEIR